MQRTAGMIALVVVASFAGGFCAQLLSPAVADARSTRSSRERVVKADRIEARTISLVTPEGLQRIWLNADADGGMMSFYTKGSGGNPAIIIAASDDGRRDIDILDNPRRAGGPPIPRIGLAVMVTGEAAMLVTDRHGDPTWRQRSEERASDR